MNFFFFPGKKPEIGFDKSSNPQMIFSQTPITLQFLKIFLGGFLNFFLFPEKNPPRGDQFYIGINEKISPLRGFFLPGLIINIPKIFFGFFAIGKKAPGGQFLGKFGLIKKILPNEFFQKNLNPKFQNYFLGFF